MECSYGQFNPMVAIQTYMLGMPTPVVRPGGEV